jgi:RimJ/RimL family protein N-acetyltransferase
MEASLRLEIGDSFYISDISSDDESAFVEYLNDNEIYDRTLRLPFPYTRDHAREYIEICEKLKKEYGKAIQWAIREPLGKLIGGIGIESFEIDKEHKTSLGYWLAKPFRNQGIMTRAVIKVTEYLFNEFPKLVRIQAETFDFNMLSAKVLEKAGYHFEGLLKNYHKKGDQIIGCRMYAKIREV